MRAALLVVLALCACTGNAPHVEETASTPITLVVNWTAGLKK